MLFRKHTIGTELCGGHLGYSVYSENTQLVQNHVMAILDIQSIQKTHNWHRTMWWPSWIFSLSSVPIVCFLNRLNIQDGHHMVLYQLCVFWIDWISKMATTWFCTNCVFQNYVVAILDIQSIQKTHNWHRTMWWPSWISSLFRKHTIGTEPCGTNCVFSE
jgi:hypothetical protein